MPVFATCNQQGSVPILPLSLVLGLACRSSILLGGPFLLRPTLRPYAQEPSHYEAIWRRVGPIGFWGLTTRMRRKKKEWERAHHFPRKEIRHSLEVTEEYPCPRCHNWLLLVTERPHVIRSPIQLNKIRFVRHLLHQDFHKKKFDLAVSTPSREDLSIRVLGTLLEGLPSLPHKKPTDSDPAAWVILP